MEDKDKNSKKYNKVSTNKPDTEYVFITDIAGISSAFSSIRQKLTDQVSDALSLVYYIDNEDIRSFIFKKELNFFERRYPNIFLSHYINYQKLSDLNFEILEVIINCCTKAHQQFLLYGITDFVKIIEKRLHFLNIEHKRINIKIYKKEK